MNIKFSEIKKSFMTPVGNLSRYFQFGLIFLCGLMSFWAYYYIEYELCGSEKCTDLVVTKIIAELTPLYIIQGICLLIVSLFIKRNSNIPKLYMSSISIACAGGYMYSSFFVAALAIELKGLT